MFGLVYNWNNLEVIPPPVINFEAADDKDSGNECNCNNSKFISWLLPKFKLTPQGHRYRFISKGRLNLPDKYIVIPLILSWLSCLILVTGSWLVETPFSQPSDWHWRFSVSTLTEWPHPALSDSPSLYLASPWRRRPAVVPAPKHLLEKDTTLRKGNRNRICIQKYISLCTSLVG